MINENRYVVLLLRLCLNRDAIMEDPDPDATNVQPAIQCCVEETRIRTNELFQHVKLYFGPVQTLPCRTLCWKWKFGSIGQTVPQ